MRPQSRWFLHAVALLIAIAGLHGCQEDNCVGVSCGPVPIPLEVVVRDTVGVDTTLQVTRGGNLVIVDTTLIFRRFVEDASVRLLRAIPGDTTFFDSIPFTGVSYARNSTTGLSGNFFLLVATRGNRSDTVRDVSLREVGGCCPYSIVGRFQMDLPEK